MTENKCGYQMHIFVTSFSKPHRRPCVAVLLHGAATSSAISPQMHQQNPADAPPESRGTIRIRRTPTESCLHLQRVIVDAMAPLSGGLGGDRNESNRKKGNRKKSNSFG